MLKVAISGGGIGGLTCGLALLQRLPDSQVTIYEKTSDFKPLGAGITLAPNGLRVLSSLGLPLQADFDVAPERVGFLDKEGRWISPLANGKIKATYGLPVISIYRPRLQKMLLDAFLKHGGEVQYGKTLISFEQDLDTTVELNFSDNTVSCDVLVGADGINSAIRNQLWGLSNELTYTGQTYWRGVVPYNNTDALANMGEFWGQGQLIGIMPMLGQIHWNLAKNVPEDYKLQPDAVKPTLLKWTEGWPEPIQQLITGTPHIEINTTKVYSLSQTLNHWSKGSVTLLGDAAHTVNPALGQGACIAIEDAWVLADCLSKEPNNKLALINYEQKRKLRTAKIVKQAAQICSLIKLENSFLCNLRNLFLRSILASDSPNKVDWTFNFNLT